MSKISGELIDAIKAALEAEFGDTYEIHTMETEQDLKKPCFFIATERTEMKLFFGKKYLWKSLFCIRYFPQTAEKRQECHGIAERLMRCLEYVAAGGDLMRGSGMSCRIESGILLFFVSYDSFVYRRDETAVMEDLETRIGTGGDGIVSQEKEKLSVQKN